MSPIIPIGFLHFSPFFSSDCIISNDLSSGSQILLLDQSRVDALYCIFHFIQCILQLQNFGLVLYDVYLSVELLILFMYYFLDFIEFFICVLL